ncbi:hypothetical protein ACQW5G_03240 [Fructilactobacillus sp. Tb1]|uniref:hypothetical protein n=1 Tax=Fructilactobacillus sp. Tb1 TaxID=3422304 RepID=UPI003D269AE9
MKNKTINIILYAVIIFNLFLLTGIFKPKHHQKVSASMGERSEMTINVKNKSHYQVNKHGQFIIHSSLVIGKKIHFSATNPNVTFKVTRSGSAYKTVVALPAGETTNINIYSSGKELTNSYPVNITLTNKKETQSTD